MRSSTAKITAGILTIGLALGTSVVVSAQNDRSETDPAAAPFQREEDPNIPVGGEPPPPPTAGELLAERARQLDAREAEVEQAMKDLQAAERALDAKIARLENLLAERKRVEQKIQTAAEEARAAKIARMTEVTGKMPPERAALYLTELDVRTAAKILETMKSRKAAAIMASMLPSKAAEISRMYLQSGKSSRTPRPTEAGGAEPTR